MASKVRENRSAFRGAASIPAKQAAKHFAAVVESAHLGKERVALTRRGKTLAAVVSAEDLAILELIDDVADVDMFRSALADWERDGRRTVALNEALRKLGLRV